MSRHSARVLLAASLALLGACSLVVDVPLPEEGTDDDCDFLNAEKPEGVDQCTRWQFNATRKQCELVPLDRDRDGFHPDSCREPLALAANQIDCDDATESTFPDAPEACDGVDNDCDTHVDEGVLQPRMSDGPTVTYNPSISDLLYAVDPASANTVGLAYSLNPNNVPGVVVRDRGLASETAERFSLYTAAANNTTATQQEALGIVSTSIGIGSLGGDLYAIAYVQAGNNRRVVAGVATKDRARTLHVEASVFDNGLPCAASDGDCTTPPLADRPVIGVAGTDVLVSIVRRSSATDECGTSVTDAPVVGNALRHRPFSNVRLNANSAPNAFPALRPTTENPTGIDLGAVRVDATPAVVGIPDVGFLLALPQADNTILLRTVTITDGVYAVATGRDLVFRMASDEDPLLEPAFALGTDPSDGHPVVGMAFRRGCGGAGTVQVKLFDLNMETGRIAARPGEPRQVDGTGFSGAISESRPAISFAAEHGNTWAVAYAKQSDLRARVLAFDGSLHGDASYTLIDAADRLGRTPAVFPVPVGSFGGALYGAMVDATIDGEPGVYTVHLGCFAAAN